MTDKDFDSIIEQVEATAQRLASQKPVIISFLAYAVERRKASDGEDRTEWRKETVRLDIMRKACNELEKMLAK